jgi:hypothetical protein
MQVYALTSSRSLHETPDLFLTREAAELRTRGQTSCRWNRRGCRRTPNRTTRCFPRGSARIGGHTLGGMPEEKRPDIRPQLREFLAWYEEVLGRIQSGAIVAPGEQERLTEEASAVAHLLDLLDSRADEPAS